MPPEHRNSLIEICARETGLTQSEVVSIAATGPKRYFVYTIDKRSGGKRTICHPSRELKALQYVFLDKILANLPVHDAATAYKTGASIKENARRHEGSRVILKLDFENFFPSITVGDWTPFAEAVLGWNADEIKFSAYVMFWGAGGYEPTALSIGAPTSPLISNAMMFGFDSAMSEYAAAHGQVYTRYADDIVISATDFLDKPGAMAAVQQSINGAAIAGLKLNSHKTRLASKATMRQITGLKITNEGRVSLGRERKRLIRSMVHRALSGRVAGGANATLSGLLSFAKDVEPTFYGSLLVKFGEEKMTALLKGKV